MGKFLGRIVVYFVFLSVLGLLLPGIIFSVSAFLLLALVLALANGIVRPILTFIALPFNLLLIGVASVFVNMLMLLLACAIAGVAFGGFWLLLLVSVVIMAADAVLRCLRRNDACKGCANQRR